MVLDLASRRREVDSPVVSLGSVRDAAEVLVLVFRPILPIPKLQ